MSTLTTKKKIIFTAITVVLLFVVVESAFRIWNGYRNKTAVAEKIATLAAYRNDPEAKEFFKDDSECVRQSLANPKYDLYVRYIMIDVYLDCTTKLENYHSRTRDTWNPPINASDTRIKVYEVGIFGGSTMIGLSSTDDKTIASQFSHLANAATSSKVVYHVTNYGVSSYTFTQGVMKLITLLREGKHFDYVIFYDGANDVDNAYDSGEAGSLVSEQILKNKLEGGTWDQVKDILKQQLNSCATCKAVVIFFRNTPVLKDYISPYLVRLRNLILFQAGDSKNAQGIETLAHDISSYYAKSHVLLNDLSRAYGFKYLTFWQPTLQYRDKPIKEEENLLRIDPKITDEKHRKVYEVVVQDLAAARLPNFFDISDALLGRTEPYYVDAVHISGAGNAVVAKRIFDIFEKNR